MLARADRAGADKFPQVAFGKVLEGMDVVNAIGRYFSSCEGRFGCSRRTENVSVGDNDLPEADVIIADSGEVRFLGCMLTISPDRTFSFLSTVPQGP